MAPSKCSPRTLLLMLSVLVLLAIYVTMNSRSLNHDPPAFSDGVVGPPATLSAFDVRQTALSSLTSAPGIASVPQRALTAPLTDLTESAVVALPATVAAEGTSSEPASTRNTATTVEVALPPRDKRHMAYINLTVFPFAFDDSRLTSTLTNKIVLNASIVDAEREPVKLEGDDVPLPPKGARMSRIALQPFTPIVENGIEVGIRVAGSGDSNGSDLYYPAFQKENIAEEERFKGNSSDERAVFEESRRIAPLLAPHCPIDRFLVVRSQHWGRHHNQLQSLMNAIAAGDFLNRTVILTDFLFEIKKNALATGVMQNQPINWFYDFTEIQRRYCVLMPEEAEKMLLFVSRIGRKITSACRYNHFMSADPYFYALFTPQCESINYHGPAPPFADDDLAVTSKQYARALVFQSTYDSRTVLMLDTQSTFYLRAGIWPTIMIYRHLRPNATIGMWVDEKIRSMMLTMEGKVIQPAEIAPLQQTYPVYPHFGVHSRWREGHCIREIGDDEKRHKGFLSALSKPVPKSCEIPGMFVNRSLPFTAWNLIKKQCNIDIPYLHWIAQMLGFKDGIDSFSNNDPAGTTPKPRLFLSSDGQRNFFENSMRDKGSFSTNVKEFRDKYWNGELLGLAVDFFLLTRGAYFTGNQVSSVSQNVCFMRLANGLTCDGWFPLFTLYHQQHILAL